MVAGKTYKPQGQVPFHGFPIYIFIPDIGSVPLLNLYSLFSR